MVLGFKALVLVLAVALVSAPVHAGDPNSLPPLPEPKPGPTFTPPVIPGQFPGQVPVPGQTVHTPPPGSIKVPPIIPFVNPVKGGGATPVAPSVPAPTTTGPNGGPVPPPTGYGGGLPPIPAVVPAVPEQPAPPSFLPPTPAPTTGFSAFNGFAIATSGRSYSLVNLVLPQTGGAIPTDWAASRADGTLVLGNSSYRLSSSRLTGPYTMKSGKSSPYAPSLEGEAAIWSPPSPPNEEVRYWLLYVDVYPTYKPPQYVKQYGQTNTWYLNRRIGGIKATILQKIDNRVYMTNTASTPASIRWPGPQNDVCLVDGELTLWSYRYRILATGSATGGVPAPVPMGPTPLPPADGIGTDDLIKR